MEPASLRTYRRLSARHRFCHLCSSVTYLPHSFHFIHSIQTRGLMSLPVIAITNASTCLTDAQVGAVLSSLQRQVSYDFKAYWGLDCSLIFLPKTQTLVSGWWQIVVTDNPD